MADIPDTADIEPGAGPGPGTDTEPTLRESLDEAFEQVATDEAPAPGPHRDAAGRFAAQAREDAAAAAAAKSLTPGVTRPAPQPGPPGVGEPAPEFKAPAQWKPDARERWAGVDPLIKAEVTRREREFQAHLQQSSGFRDFVDQFTNIVRPYEMFIRAENSNPLQAVQNLMQTAAELRVGTPQSKAMLVAGMVQQYAIDLQMLDTALAQRYGVATQGINPQFAQQPQQQQVFQDPRVDQFIAMQVAQQQQQDQAETQEIYSETEKFANAHEFFMDVKDDMADMIEIAGRRGFVLTVNDAYEKACQLNPEVAKILSQRSTPQTHRASTMAALRAKRAASSIKGESSPHGATVAESDTLRGAIEAAFDSAGPGRM